MAQVYVKWTASSDKWWKDKKALAAAVKAARMAGGDAIRAVRTTGKRGVRQRVRLRASYLASKSFPLHYARGRSLDELTWRMDVSGQAVPLGEYPSRQTKKGVSVEVERGKRMLIKSAFLRRRKNDVGLPTGVFLRPTTKRYPMGHRLGLRVSDAMSESKVENPIVQNALRRGGLVFSTAFARLFALELKKG